MRVPRSPDIFLHKGYLHIWRCALCVLRPPTNGAAARAHTWPWLATAKCFGGTDGSSKAAAASQHHSLPEEGDGPRRRIDGSYCSVLAGGLIVQSPAAVPLCSDVMCIGCSCAWHALVLLHPTAAERPAVDVVPSIAPLLPCTAASCTALHSCVHCAPHNMCTAPPQLPPLISPTTTTPATSYGPVKQLRHKCAFASQDRGRRGSMDAAAAVPGVPACRLRATLGAMIMPGVTARGLPSGSCWGLESGGQKSSGGFGAVE